MTKHGLCMQKMLEILEEHPSIWFCNITMAMTIGCNAATVQRNKKRLILQGILDKRGGYFRAKLIRNKTYKTKLHRRKIIVDEENTI